MTMNKLDPEIADLVRGLTHLRGRTLSTRKGGHVNQRLSMTQDEYRALAIIRGAVSTHVGQVVSLPLVNRLALNALTDRCIRSFNDPVEAAKLRADLIATREERRAGRRPRNDR